MFTKPKVTQSMIDAVNEALKGDQHKIDMNKNKKIDAQDFELLRNKKEVKEELKGDQHKIDANKNNKIDAHDFALLRGKKKVKEFPADTSSIGGLPYYGKGGKNLKKKDSPEEERQQITQQQIDTYKKIFDELSNIF